MDLKVFQVAKAQVVLTADQVFRVPEVQWAKKALSGAKVCEVATVNKVIEVKKVL